MRAALILAAICLAGAARAQPAPAQSPPDPAHDYPTAARADYVIGCLASAGFKRELLERCSCNIDTIAKIMPYDHYDEASTILSMQQGALGGRGAIMRDTPIARERLEELRKAQAEASVSCH